MRARTTGAIAMTPTGNAQGGYYFLSLTTGARISRQQWDALPMPDGVIEAVERMAEAEQQPLVLQGAPLFEWQPGVEIQDEAQPPLLQDEHDHAGPEPTDLHGGEGADEVLFGEDPVDIDEEEDEDDADDEEYVDEDEEHAEDEAEEEMIATETSEYAPDAGEQRSVTEYAPDAGEQRSVTDELEDDYELEDADEEESDTDAPIDIAPETSGHTDDAPTDETQTSHNLRPNRERKYDNRLGHIMDNPANSQSYDAQFLQEGQEEQMTLREAVEDMQKTGLNDNVLRCLTGIIMVQMTAKAGIRKHGQVAIDALFAEFLQLHDLGVFEGQDTEKLTSDEKRAALRALNMIKEKRCGRIKGRTVADGRKQRGLFKKEETASPTVSNDALMLSIIIDALERRAVATADVAGAYLKADMVDFTLLKMEGESVDILCNVHEGYRKFVTYENGKKVLYLKLLKALYGCVQSALLWYELFAGSLQEMGFKLNPYDTCIANKTIEGKQCTIAWFVDDTKISHENDKVVSNVIELIETRFGKMTVTQGKKHVFLGMDIEYRENGTATIKMKEYIKESIVEFGEPIVRTAATPARKGLFDIDEDSGELTKGAREIFHSVVAKLLYVSKRGRQDIQLPIAFLCTRVACSTEQDWTKLRRVLEYLNGTLDEFLTLGADDIRKMKTWVDASYAVHKDMKSHTGGVVSFGRGAAMSKSSKHKINVKSSTEAELVGASDYLPYPIWAKKFLEAQGYPLEENIFYQDNQSTIRFEKNGRKSCGPNSRHIDIRYFFIKDRIDIENIDVQHCPTEQMLADFFTKPLQGHLFRKFRAVIMGHEHIDTLKETKPTPSQERVGEDTKSEHMRNGTGGQTKYVSADVSTREPSKVPNADTEVYRGGEGSNADTEVSYADIVKKGNNTERERRKKSVSPPLTFRK
jgi:hypothetical protein